jgi:DNA-binding NtrC family response regulator
MTDGLDTRSAGANGDGAPDAGGVASAGARVPMCFVDDDDSSIRHFLSLILHGAGVDTEEFADGKAFSRPLPNRLPDLVLLNVGLESGDAIQAVIALAKRGYLGFVQLMSNRGSAVIEHVKSVGDQHRLHMLPVLKKPFDTGAILKIMQMLKLGHLAPIAARIDLDDACAPNGSSSGTSPRSTCARSSLPAPRPSPAPAIPSTVSCRRQRSCRARPSPN